MKKIFSLVLISAFLFSACTTDQITTWLNENNPFDPIEDETEIVFITGNYHSHSSMYFNGDSGQEIFWFTFQTYEPGEGNCNIKCLEHDQDIDHAYLSNVSDHEFGNMDISICDFEDAGNGITKYYAGNVPEWFDGKTHANVTCNCTMWAIHPDGSFEIGDKLYLKKGLPNS